MKFRRLNNEELQELEQEFVQFLVTHSITAPDWVKLKVEDPTKAEGLVDLFSDIVFEKIVGNIQYLEYRTPDDIKTFHCQEDKIVMNGLLMEGKAEIDLTTDLPPAEMFNILQAADVKLQIYTAQKGYVPGRAAELFRMLEGGAKISREGQLFRAIEGFKGA
ncbi:MAG: DUF6495 family protein [Bacteroidota bacterium]